MTNNGVISRQSLSAPMTTGGRIRFRKECPQRNETKIFKRPFNYNGLSLEYLVGARQYYSVIIKKWINIVAFLVSRSYFINLLYEICARYLLIGFFILVVSLNVYVLGMIVH